MSRKHYTRSDITYLILISFFGIFLLVMLTAFPPLVTGNNPWRKPLIGSIFSAICGLGILAAFSPTQCSKIFNLRRREKLGSSRLGKMSFSHGLSSLQGHHPNCGKFDAHVFRIKNKPFCAACIGLLFGGLLALAG